MASTRSLRTCARRALLLTLAAPAASAALPAVAPAQQPPAQQPPAAAGTVRGVVRRADGDSAAIAGVSVVVRGSGAGVRTGADGRFALSGVPAGTRTIAFRLLGYAPFETAVVVPEGGSVEVNAQLTAAAVTLGNVVVSAASRAPQRIVEAPAAISVVPSDVLTTTAATGQAPLALQAVPGVDIVQSGINDFNVNARGFNSSLNRRVLVLLDGRDLSTAFLANQEWNALPAALDDLGRMEMVRGPGSALYGANAFSGVLNITSFAPRDVVGSKVSVSGGELSTYRADVRNAGVFGGGRFGYRVAGGYNQSESFTISRTRLDSSDVVTEYRPATDDSVARYREARPVNGQTLAPTTFAAVGEPDPLTNAYGAARLDYYAANEAVGTVEAGLSEVTNETLVTGIGRVQIGRARRPYARVAYAAPRYNVMGWYSGRETRDPQHSLASGVPLNERSAITHVEGQVNQSFLGDRGRVVAGASARNAHINTDSTLMAPGDDDRDDQTYSAYAQAEYAVSDKLRAVVAGRFDDGNLFARQFSPKGALVYSLSPNHALRATYNRAFQTPNYSEFFLRVAAAAPTTRPRALEVGLEQYFAAVRGAFAQAGASAQLAPLNLPTNLPYEFAASTPVLALGNRDVDVERVTGYEVGYKGEFARRLFVTLDGYLNRKRNFVTDLVRGVNPDYPPLLTQGGDLTTTFAQLEALINSTQSLSAQTRAALLANLPALRAGYAGLANFAAPLPDGSRALVLSYTNAAVVDERGLEFGLGAQLSGAVRADVNYAWFDFEVREASAAGDQLLPNTPPNKGTVAVSYARERVDAGVSARFVESFPWAAGVFTGVVPAQQTLNANVGYRITDGVRLHATATNLLDQQRFQLYGGSVIGRRIIAGATARF